MSHDFCTFPLRKSPASLIEEEVDSELMVLDLSTRKAICLNRSAAVVWEHCDGKTSTEELARLLAEEFGTPADVRVVEFALRKLDQEGLMEYVPAPLLDDANLGRRRLFRKLGWAAAAMVALPLVLTVGVTKANATYALGRSSSLRPPANDRGELAGNANQG
jgi:hypothetical protein